MHKSTLLLVANYPSDVGYAWWLMESFWVTLAEHYHVQQNVILAYPGINKLPAAITKAPLTPVVQDFSHTGFFQLVKQCQFLIRHRVRAIYFSDRSTWSLRYALYRLCGVRLIVTHDHTPGLRTVPHGLKLWLKKIRHRIPFVTVDGAIGATQFVRQRLIDVVGMPESRCFAAPNGLPTFDTPPETADLHELFRIPPHRKKMIMTGRANRYKGVLFILVAMAKLDLPTRNKLHFIFVGDGPDLEMFKQRAVELRIADHCSFPGRRNDIPSLLEGADFAIHASLGEVGYSLSILEYMQAGLSVIVPDNPSVCGATIDGQTGLIYREHNVDDAATAIQKLVIDDKFREQLGEAAMTSMHDYTLEQTHKALIHVFESIDRLNLLKKPVNIRP